jgi:hypothetical protein
VPARIPGMVQTTSNREFYENTPIERLACEMYMFIQGCVDASRVFGMKLTKILTEPPLSLRTNRADTCMLSGVYDICLPIIIAGASLFS